MTRIGTDLANKARKEKKRLRKKEAKWEWRTRYRVWETNRKIFIYPENWIEPDLRLPDRCLVSLCRVVAFVRAQCNARTQGGKNRKLPRAKGVSLLLTGKNRVGRLVAAQVLASDLGLDLYRIELSAVVNKFIGETEKNLRRIFDAAEQGSAILLFDEADALFGKRTEVNDSHDRYANIELNYLLRKIKDREGLAILSTNSRRGLDEAILRRFHFVIRVPPPRKPC